MSNKTKNKLIGLAVGVFITALMIGMLLGRYDSPEYTNRVSVVQFLIANAIVKSNNGDVKMRLAAGAYEYDYSLLKDQVKREQLPPDHIVALKKRKRWRSLEEARVVELLGIASPAGMAASFAGINSTARRLSRVAKYRIFAAVALGLTVSGLAGYYLTYNDEADYDNETFVKVLLDPESWRGTANLASACDKLGALKGDREEVLKLKASGAFAALVNDKDDGAVTLINRCIGFEEWLRRAPIVDF